MKSKSFRFPDGVGQEKKGEKRERRKKTKPRKTKKKENKTKKKESVRLRRRRSLLFPREDFSHLISAPS